MPPYAGFCFSIACLSMQEGLWLEQISYQESKNLEESAFVQVGKPADIFAVSSIFCYRVTAITISICEKQRALFVGYRFIGP